MFRKLTTPQENMYDTQQFFYNTGICNVGGCIFFKEKIDTSILKEAINKVIKNSDGLRVKLKINNTDVLQYVEKYTYENISIESLEKENYKHILENYMEKPFDILGKLYDFKIININNEIGVFIKLHHVISDAWSTALIGQKIAQYYEILKNNDCEENDIPSYEKFINNEETYFHSAKYTQDKEFWEKRYSTKPTYVTMSPNNKSDLNVEAGRSSFVLCGKIYELIYKYCNDNQISLAVLFEAVTILYLARINNVDDVTLCSVVINRSGIEEKNTIGMFNNILPFTISVNYQEDFLSLCQRISMEHYQVFRHQKYPLNKIMKYIRGKHGKDTMLYDAMVSYQNAQINSDIISKTEWIFNRTSDLGFMLNISELSQNGEIDINIDWRKNCFNSQEIEEIFNRFIYVIEQIIEKQDITVKEVEIATKEEKNQILVDFNNTIKDYPKEKRIHDFLEENVKNNPNKIALKFENMEMTYKEFNEKVNSLANYIIESIKAKNTIIGIMCERSFEMMIGIYAIIKSGNSYMPIDPHFPKDRIDFMIEDSKTPVVLTQTKWVANLESVNNKIDLNKFEYEKYSKENPNIQILPTDVAYVIYTSGSTGKPKGAMIEHHSAINRIKWMHEKYPLENEDVILQKTPYTFDVSVWELFWWSMYNGTLNIIIPEGHKDPLEIIQSIKKGKVTHIHFVPSMLNAFLEYLENNKELIKDIGTLKYVFVSGEALQVEHVKKFYNLLKENGTTLHNLYGPTECTVDVSYYDCDYNNIPTSIPIGKPIDNTQLLVLDKNQKILPIGVVGELYISGVQVGKGYVNRDELTKEKFVSNPYYNYPTMYKTGDLAMWLSDGNIEYCGRTDFQIKIRGLRVELGDIENAILMFEGIKQVIVTVFEKNGEKNICGYYTSNKDIEINKLKQHLSKILPDYMVPQYYVRLEKMPLNANGKIDRKVLPIPNVNIEEKEYVSPSTELEKLIQDSVLEILKVKKVSCDRDLFDCGLSSLGVISVITKLSSYGYELKVRDFYENSTIKQIAHALEDTMEADEDYEEDKREYSDVSDIKNHLLPMKEEGAILLTGATSFLAIHIIQEIIENTDRNIYCLIRNEEKFKRLIENYTDIKFPNERLIIIKGDITLDNIGLENNEAKIIKQKISDVIHCAADVSFFCSWEKSKKINYTGTCNVLKFAEDAKAKLHHISTMSVSGDILTRQTKDYPEFTEDKLYIGQLYKENVYAHSKYLAEKEIIKAIREDRINASIYRVANLTWRAKDGKFQENYEVNDLYILTKVMLECNKIPSELMQENISLTPVDDCAKAITKLLEIKENNIYNLYSKNSMSIEKYIKALQNAEPISMKDFYDFLSQKEDVQSQFVSMYIAGILKDTKQSVVHIINDKTNRQLFEQGYRWSELGDKYVKMFESIGGR